MVRQHYLRSGVYLRHSDSLARRGLAACCLPPALSRRSGAATAEDSSQRLARPPLRSASWAAGSRSTMGRGAAALLSSTSRSSWLSCGCAAPRGHPIRLRSCRRRRRRRVCSAGDWGVAEPLTASKSAVRPASSCTCRRLADGSRSGLLHRCGGSNRRRPPPEPELASLSSRGHSGHEQRSSAAAPLRAGVTAIMT